MDTLDLKYQEIKKLEKEYVDVLRNEFPKSLYLFDERINDEERKRRYKDFKSILDKLRNPFRKVVLERNKLMNMHNLPNLFTYLLFSRKIPLDKLDWYFKVVDDFISLVHQDYPSNEIFKENKEWTILHLPHPYGGRWFRPRFNSIDEIMDKISDYDPRISKYRDRIRITIHESDISEHNYIPEKGIVEITLTKNTDDSDKVYILVYKLGAALETLELVEKGEKAEAPKSYQGEYELAKFVYKFVKLNYLSKHQKMFVFNLLHHIVQTLFEFEIYTNDSQDFDEAYARVVNRVYPMARQKANPFYLMDEWLITAPLDSFLYSAPYIEFYLKEKELENSN